MNALCEVCMHSITRTPTSKIGAECCSRHANALFISIFKSLRAMSTTNQCIQTNNQPVCLTGWLCACQVCWQTTQLHSSNYCIIIKYLLALILSIICVWPLLKLILIHNSLFLCKVILIDTLFLVPTSFGSTADMNLQYSWINHSVCYFSSAARDNYCQCFTHRPVFFINLIYFVYFPPNLAHHRHSLFFFSFRNIIIACKFIANMYKQNNWHLSSWNIRCKIINKFKAISLFCSLCVSIETLFLY